MLAQQQQGGENKEKKLLKCTQISTMVTDSQWSFGASGTGIKCFHHKTMSNIDDISVPGLLNELPHSMTIFDECFLLQFLLLLLPWIQRSKALLLLQMYPGNQGTLLPAYLDTRLKWSVIITFCNKIEHYFCMF